MGWNVKGRVMRRYLAALVALAASAQAQAFEALATVINVAPVTETVSQPTQRCWTEYQQQTYRAAPEHGPGGAIVGGITGGLLGSLMGEGNGKVAAAAV